MTRWVALIPWVSLGAQGLDIEAIDKSCKPCDDFHQYAMGTWLAKNPIPDSKPRWGKRWVAADSNLEIVQGIAQAAADRGSAARGDERLIGDFFAACTDIAALDAAGAKPIEETLRHIASMASAADVPREIAWLARRGTSVPIRLVPRAHPDDTNRVVATIVRSALTLPAHDYYLKDDPKSKMIREKFLAYASQLMTLAALPPEGARTVLSMETAFARGQMSSSEERDPHKTTNLKTPEELGQLTPAFDWKVYFASAGAPFDGPVNVLDPGALAEFQRQLTTTPLNEWKTWLSWRVIRDAAPHLSGPFRQAAYEFEEAHLQGRTGQEPRTKTCAELADRGLADSLGRVYAAKMFPPAAKAKVQEMVGHIRAALGESIKGLQWMTAATKENALAKVATFDAKVGYPDRWRPYAGEPMDRLSHFRNIESTGVARQKDQLSQIGKPVDRTRWAGTVPMFDAYYNAPLNEIVFYAGILTPPVFHIGADDAVNYGAIGGVIGHELSHGFDDRGSLFDAAGRLKNWWTPDDRKQFLARTQCVVDQFESYFIEPGAHHNGKLVLGESLGDLGGARIAFLAYQKSLEGKPRPKDIDGFTAEQRFFLSWGQSRGDSTRIEYQRRMIVSDPHPVAKYRVIGPLSNMPEFHRAFGCKRGDAMVREGDKQCRVW